MPNEYPQNGNAPKALNNAAAVYEKEKKQDEAVAAYRQLADKYPTLPKWGNGKASPSRERPSAGLSGDCRGFEAHPVRPFALISRFPYREGPCRAKIPSSTSSRS